MRLLSVLVLLLAGCTAEPSPAAPPMQAEASRGELAARPGQSRAGAALTGLRQLGTGARSASLYVPESYRPASPTPFILMLHGAGGSGRHSIDLVKAEADRLGIIVLAPSSSAASWDIISARRYGADVAAIDAALTTVFRDYAIDPSRVAIGGFSDGASYALSLGLANGSLFRRIIAFSPGFMQPGRTEGKPAIFISHGIADRVLPIDVCSRRMVPLLKRAGYDVDYVEFPGGHTVPPDLARRAYEAFAQSRLR
jgi:phospholipase/carboxylesterase